MSPGDSPSFHRLLCVASSIERASSEIRYFHSYHQESIASRKYHLPKSALVSFFIASEFFQPSSRTSDDSTNDAMKHLLELRAAENDKDSPAQVAARAMAQRLLTDPRARVDALRARIDSVKRDEMAPGKFVTKAAAAKYRQILSRCVLVLSASEVPDVDVGVIEPMVSSLIAQMSLQETYRPAITRLQAMRAMIFYVRYCGPVNSMGWQLSWQPLKNQADQLPAYNPKALVPPAPPGVDGEAWAFFLSKPWPDIYIRLLDEYTSSQKPDAPEADPSTLPPLLSLIHRLAAFADWKFPRVWLMMTMCTRPLSVINLDELAKQDRLDEVKLRLEIDLQDLAILPPIVSDFVSLIQTAIRDMGENRYFSGMNWSKYCDSVIAAAAPQVE